MTNLTLPSNENIFQRMSNPSDIPSLPEDSQFAPDDPGVVWVVEEDGVRESLTFALMPQFETIVYPNATEFLARADLDRPGCLIVAEPLSMTTSGDVQIALRQMKCPVSVILLASQPDIRTAVRAMAAGAVSVLEKPVDPDELASAVEVGLVRSKRLYRRRRLLLMYESLSRRERQIFIMICQGLKNSDIAPLLNLSQRTVEVHRAHIGRKLGNAAPVRLLYELAKTTEDGSVLTADFEGIDQEALERAIAEATSSN